MKYPKTVFCVFFVLIISGCVQQSNPPENVSVISGIGKEYDSISAPLIIDGKIVYEAISRDRGIFIVKGDKEVKEEGIVSSLFKVDGKLGYIVNKGNKQLVVYDGLRGKEYLTILSGLFEPSPTEIDGKICYTVSDGNKNFIVCGIQEIGKEYDSARSPIDINGKLAYIAEKDNKTLIVYDNQVIREYDHDYVSWRGLYRIESLMEINGKLAYLVEKYPYSSRYYLVYDGKDIGNEYYSIEEPLGIDGKLAYVAWKNDTSSFVIFDGQELGTEYDGIINISEIDGKLAYVALKRMPFKKFVVYDGQQIGNYEDIDRDSLIEINGKLAFRAERDTENFIVYDGKEFGNEYNLIEKPFSLNGKLAFFVLECVSSGMHGTCYEKFFVYDGKEIGKDYEYVHYPIGVGGKIVYVAVLKNGKNAMVVEG